MVYDIRFAMGSKSDWKMGNIFLAIMKKFGVAVYPSIASCHWSAGKEYTDFISSIEEDLVAIMGGMSLAAPGIAESTIRNLERFNKIVFGIPLDESALSAIQDLPPGVSVLTCGFNKKDVQASVTNSALAVARLVGRDNPKVRQKIVEYYAVKRKEKGVVEKIELDENGLIPEPKK